MIIISIGVDCGMAMFLNANNLRHLSFPFDWNVTYTGVSKCLDDNFKHFTEPLNNNRINQYDVFFYHDFEKDECMHQDKEKYIRRCQRLLDLLQTTDEEIIFCRKGHARHHHYEQNGKYADQLNDLDDAEKLDVILQQRFPSLKYKIVVILVCGHCFHSLETYKSKSDNIDVYNIATPEADSGVFEDLCRSIFII